MLARLFFVSVEALVLNNDRAYQKPNRRNKKYECKHQPRHRNLHPQRYRLRGQVGGAGPGTGKQLVHPQKNVFKIEKIYAIHNYFSSSSFPTKKSAVSPPCAAVSCKPTGSPSTVPAGIEIAGLPVRLAGIVNA